MLTLSRVRGGFALACLAMAVTAAVLLSSCQKSSPPPTAAQAPEAQAAPAPSAQQGSSSSSTPAPAQGSAAAPLTSQSQTPPLASADTPRPDRDDFPKFTDKRASSRTTETTHAGARTPPKLDRPQPAPPPARAVITERLEPVAPMAYEKRHIEVRQVPSGTEQQSDEESLKAMRLAQLRAQWLTQSQQSMHYNPSTRSMSQAAEESIRHETAQRATGATKTTATATPPPPLVTPPATTASLPPFEWPPPQPSEQYVLPRSVFGAPSAELQFADVDRVLVSALGAAGYSERSYYAVPDGFALATRIEQIDADGTPKPPPARFALDPQPVSMWRFNDYFQALIKGVPGYYRVLVFVLTDASFRASGQRPSEAQAIAFVSAGDNVLPPEVGALPFAPAVNCTVLIYEFTRQPGADSAAQFAQPGRLDAMTHLVKSGLWTRLSGR